MLEIVHYALRQQSNLIPCTIHFIQKQFDYRTRFDLRFRFPFTVWMCVRACERVSLYRFCCRCCTFNRIKQNLTVFRMLNQLHTRLDIKIKNLYKYFGATVTFTMAFVSFSQHTNDRFVLCRPLGTTKITIDTK